MASSCCSPECGVRAGRLRRRLERLRDGGGDDEALVKALAALQKVSDRCEGTAASAERAEMNTERPSQKVSDRCEGTAASAELNAELNTERPSQKVSDRCEGTAPSAELNTERAELNTERPSQKVSDRCEGTTASAELNTELNTERPPQKVSDRCEGTAASADLNTELNTERPSQSAELNTECLALYTQALLDVTYCEESRLVEAEFPGDDSLRTVRDLVQLLSEPERHPQNVALDAEVQECLHWRRGALLYMYCHTVGERERWEPRDPGAFHQCLQDGVHYLLKMLHTRSPVQLDDEVLCRDINTAALLEKGIFSDVHVLALMYCGEMCYWAQRYCGAAAPTSPLRADPETPRQNLQFKDIGEKVLDTYVGVCEGPLRGQGWSTANAKKILQYLRGNV